MSRRVIAVTAPSRLHFGLFSFGASHSLKYGGVGLMIDRPKTRIRFAHAPRLKLDVADPERVRRTIETWLQYRSGLLPSNVGQIDDLKLDVRQISGPSAHIGLGAGTQQTLAIALGLDYWFQVSPILSIEDAPKFGRAGRSAVGSHGFFLGGLLIDRGKVSKDEVGNLDNRFELPDAWRVALVCPRDRHGPSGQQEDELFRNLPPVDQVTADSLRQTVHERIIPAACNADFAELSCAIYDFGYQAGMCYGDYQGGPFNGPQVSKIVAHIRALGIAGVGQSSWGPCVFALCQSTADAEQLSAELQRTFPAPSYWHEIAAIRNQGYTVSECAEEPITMKR